MDTLAITEAIARTEQQHSGTARSNIKPLHRQPSAPLDRNPMAWVLCSL